MGQETDHIKVGWLVAAAALSVTLWNLPNGKYLLYPVTLLADWYHEMGHGLTAVLLGGRFERLLLYPNGTGQAVSGGSLLGGRLGWAMVAAGGPLASAVAGFFLVLCGRRYSAARAALWALGALLVLSAVLWMRTWFGFAYAVLAGAAVLAAAWKGPRDLHALAAQFFGVQACVSTFKEFDYLFSPRALVNGVRMRSDTAEISRLVGGPYWLWGTLLSAAVLLLLALSLRAAWRGPSASLDFRAGA